MSKPAWTKIEGTKFFKLGLAPTVGIEGVPPESGIEFKILPLRDQTTELMFQGKLDLSNGKGILRYNLSMVFPNETSANQTPMWNIYETGASGTRLEEAEATTAREIAIRLVKTLPPIEKLGAEFTTGALLDAWTSTETPFYTDPETQTSGTPEQK